LFGAVRNNNIELLRMLVNDLKISTSITDERGWTVMHEAASRGHDLMIYMLAEMGASVNCREAKDFTPLHLAVK
jgi:ankyrin repeat protein